MVTVLRSYDMSDTASYLFPLISDNLKQEDLAENTGFVDVYTYDIDRPYMEDCVFVLYKDLNTIEHFNCVTKLEKLDTYYSKKYITLNNVPHTLYAFKNAKRLKDVRNYIDFGNYVSLNSKLRIYDFWKGARDFAFVEKLFNDHTVKFLKNTTTPADYKEINYFANTI